METGILSLLLLLLSSYVCHGSAIRNVPSDNLKVTTTSDISNAHNTSINSFNRRFFVENTKKETKTIADIVKYLFSTGEIDLSKEIQEAIKDKDYSDQVNELLPDIVYPQEKVDSEFISQPSKTPADVQVITPVIKEDFPSVVYNQDKKTICYKKDDKNKNKYKIINKKDIEKEIDYDIEIKCIHPGRIVESVFDSEYHPEHYPSNYEYLPNNQYESRYGFPDSKRGYLYYGPTEGVYPHSYTHSGSSNPYVPSPISVPKSPSYPEYTVPKHYAHQSQPKYNSYDYFNYQEQIPIYNNYQHPKLPSHKPNEPLERNWASAPDLYSAPSSSLHILGSSLLVTDKESSSYGSISHGGDRRPVHEGSPVDHKKKDLPQKIPFFYLLSEHSTDPKAQFHYTVRRYRNQSKYLVDAHDFNPKFLETIYIDDKHIHPPNSVISPSYHHDQKTINCNLCNRNYNTDYNRYNDWTERYDTCHRFVAFSGIEKLDQDNEQSEKYACENDIKYEKICNPCGLRKKIAVVANEKDGYLTVHLPFVEIAKSQETFYDDQSNRYQFTSFTSYNSNFDAQYGNFWPEGYDTSQVYKYLEGSRR